MEFKLKAYNIWEQGKRENQEDSIFPAYGEIKDSDRLFILCDGMGGHSAGEIASATVCEAMSDSVFRHCPDSEGSFTEDDFREALDDAFDALDAKDDGAVKKMGTTLTFLKFHDSGCTIAHMGDSRVYHIRPGKDVEDTEILYRTSDHSLVNDLVKIGELSPEEAKHSKQKNVITRAMQPCMERRPKADIYSTCDIEPGDYFLMCSDGILEQMDDDESIKFIFSGRGGDDSRKVDMLIKSTAENSDNHSAIIVHVMDVKNPVNGDVEIVEDTPVSSGDDCPDVSENTSKTPLYRILRYVIIGVIVLLAIFVLYSVFLKKSDKKESPVREVGNSDPVRIENRDNRPQRHISGSDSQVEQNEPQAEPVPEREPSSEIQVSEDTVGISIDIAEPNNDDSIKRNIRIPEFVKTNNDIPESDNQKIRDRYEKK